MPTYFVMLRGINVSGKNVVKMEQLRASLAVLGFSCPNGYGNTKLSNTAIEKKLSVGATTRNWTTTKTLLAMAQ
jgi:uncharacterized protein (DUF1697 family)